jgi:hypothetical protein
MIEHQRVVHSGRNLSPSVFASSGSKKAGEQHEKSPEEEGVCDDAREVAPVAGKKKKAFYCYRPGCAFSSACFTKLPRHDNFMHWTVVAKFACPYEGCATESHHLTNLAIHIRNVHERESAFCTHCHSHTHSHSAALPANSNTRVTALPVMRVNPPYIISHHPAQSRRCIAAGAARAR